MLMITLEFYVMAAVNPLYITFIFKINDGFRIPHFLPYKSGGLSLFY